MLNDNHTLCTRLANDEIKTQNDTTDVHSGFNKQTEQKALNPITFFTQL